MSMFEEAKHGDTTLRRGDKDDYKLQQVQQRSGNKQTVGAVPMPPIGTFEQPIAVRGADMNLIGQSGDPLLNETQPEARGLETAQGIERQLDAGLYETDAKPAASSATTTTSASTIATEKLQQGAAAVQSAKEQAKPAVQQGMAQAKDMANQAQSVLQEKAVPAMQQGVAQAKDMALQAQTVLKEQAVPAVQQGVAQAKIALNERVLPAVHSGMAQAQTTYTDTVVPTMQNKVLPAVQAGAAQAQLTMQEKVLPAVQQGVAQAQVVLQEQILPAVQSGVAQAQHILQDTVLPAVQSGAASAQASLAQMREDGAAVTLSKADAGMRRRLSAAKEAIPEEHRARISAATTSTTSTLRLWKNQAMDVWEAQQPMLRARMLQARALIRENKLETPLLAVASLALLWAAWSFVSWMAFPHISPANEQVVVFQPDFKPSNGPTLGPDNAGMLERLTAKAAAKVDFGVMDGLHDAKLQAQDMMDHAKLRAHGLHNQARAAIPSADDMQLHGAVLQERAMDSIESIKARVAEALPKHAEPTATEKLKLHASELKQRATDALPSALHKRVAPTPAEKLQLRAEEMKEQLLNAIPSVNDMKGAAADAKARVASAMPSSGDVHKSAAELKNRAAGAIPSMPSTATRAATEATILQRIETGLRNMQTSDASLKLQDRVQHAVHLLPEQLSALRLKLGGLADKLTPEQYSYAHHNQDVFNPEDHVIEWKDQAGHVKEGLDL